jgi:uncharacterized Tic20 family protein
MSEMDETPPPPGPDEPGESVNLGKTDDAATADDAAIAPDTATGEAAQNQPGWYPDPPTGQLRWWDGQVWGAFQSAPPPPVPVGAPGIGSTGDPKSTAAMAHYLGAILLFFTCYLSWLGPLIIFSGEGKNDPFIKDQATEALNFQLTVCLAAVVSSLLIIVFIGFILLPIVYLVGIIFGVLGGTAARRGEWYRYPLSIRFIKSD